MKKNYLQTYNSVTAWMMFIAFILIGGSVSAQNAQATTGNQATVSKSEARKTEAATQQAATQTSADLQDETKLVYYHYKGITNISLAKETWAKENPEAYKKFIEAVKTSPKK